MTKRFVYVSNPAYLHKDNNQMWLRPPEDSGREAQKVAIEDVAVLMLDNAQLTISSGLLRALLEHNAAVVLCDESHLPIGMFLNLDGHREQTKIHKAQLSASKSLQYNLWKQTIAAKIKNQAAHLRQRGLPDKRLRVLLEKLKPGDTENCEAQAARSYWNYLFSPLSIPLSNPNLAEGYFLRGQHGDPPNNLLNFGYTVLRSMMARSLVGSGLLPALGIFHRNQYNSFCLADDIMEPYRPFVDALVYEVLEAEMAYRTMTREVRAYLLKLPQLKTRIGEFEGPLEVCLRHTTSSLRKCFLGESRKLKFPEIP